jgi:hypothetical protein
VARSKEKVLIGIVSEEFGGTLFGHPITSRSLTIAPVTLAAKGKGKSK